MTPTDRDPRIYFAAERTFLSWIRTGLALMGFGFVVARFGLFLKEVSAATAAADTVKSYGFSLWAGTAIVIAGVVVNALSAIEHLKTIRSLNEGRDVTGKPSTIGVALSITLVTVGLAMAAFLVIVR
jgi:putative membrane protein